MTTINGVNYMQTITISGRGSIKSACASRDNLGWFCRGFLGAHQLFTWYGVTNGTSRWPSAPPSLIRFYYYAPSFPPNARPINRPLFVKTVKRASLLLLSLQTEHQYWNFHRPCYAPQAPLLVFINSITGDLQCFRPNTKHRLSKNHLATKTNSKHHLATKSTD